MKPLLQLPLTKMLTPQAVHIWWGVKKIHAGRRPWCPGGEVYWYPFASGNRIEIASETKESALEAGRWFQGQKPSHWFKFPGPLPTAH